MTVFSGILKDSNRYLMILGLCKLNIHSYLCQREIAHKYLRLLLRMIGKGSNRDNISLMGGCRLFHYEH
jgi:hypothetical protein